MNNYLLLLLMTFLGAFGAFYFKKTSSSSTIKMLLLNKYLYCGVILYFVSAIINIYVLRFLNYSIVLPATSITYIWTFIIAKILLKENITIRKITGMTFIVCGVILITHENLW